MRRLALAAVVASALLVAVAAGGAGGPEVARMSLPASGPVLAGTSVAWIDAAATTAVRVWSGQRVRDVYVDPGGSLGRLAGSADALAFRRSSAPCAQCATATQVVGGRLGGPFRPLYEASRCHLPWASNHVDVSHGAVAFEWDDCGHDRRSVVVEDAVRPKPVEVYRRVFTGRACCFGAHVAGKHVAWGDGWGSRVVVYDRDRRRVAYVAYLPARLGAGAFDLQEDGKIALLGVAAVLWFSPREPRPHAIPFGTRGRATVATQQLIRFSADRIALLRYEGGDPRALAVLDLAGRPVRLVRFDARTVPVAGFDFDGDRLVWASATIRSRRLDCPRTASCVTYASGRVRIRLADSNGVRTIAASEFADVPLQFLAPGL